MECLLKIVQIIQKLLEDIGHLLRELLLQSSLFSLNQMVIARKTKSVQSIHDILMLHRAGDSNISEKVFTAREMNMSAGLSEK